MGSEIRKVPKGWEHPKDEGGNFVPMFEEAYIDVLEEWLKNHVLWLKGEHPDQKKYPDETKSYEYFSQWNGNPPDVNCYNHYKWSKEEAVCFQVYENISEGTPVSPVFDTLKNVENWLVEVQGFGREAAQEFCHQGWIPSFIMRPTIDQDLVERVTKLDSKVGRNYTISTKSIKLNDELDANLRKKRKGKRPRL